MMYKQPSWDFIVDANRSWPHDSVAKSELVPHHRGTHLPMPCKCPHVPPAPTRCTLHKSSVVYLNFTLRRQSRLLVRS
jgi:hypothetical protein